MPDTVVVPGFKEEAPRTGMGKGLFTAGVGLGNAGFRNHVQQACGNFGRVPHEFLTLRFESIRFEVFQLKHCRVVQAKKAK